MPPGGIRTHDLSRRAAGDLRLRPRGHWDRRIIPILNKIEVQTLFGVFRDLQISSKPVGRTEKSLHVCYISSTEEE